MRAGGPDSNGDNNDFDIGRPKTKAIVVFTFLVTCLSREGFDPYADTVGPGIYGGVVKRDVEGRVVKGAQFQGHNSRPGPVYAGGGYTPASRSRGQ